MIEPMLSVAMSMQSNKGIYALLLGSGISSSAGIKTGWGIAIDLINQIRAIHPQGKEDDPDPETWYVDTYKKQPDYSDLLDGIAKTPANRSQLLKSYFEPTEEEREEGKKLPTVAHKAIAKLVAKGYIKVIITTNFDRLLEQALEIEGVTPQIISNSNKINSAFPIVHHPCTIVKVHGDYIEADTKNTVTELAEYDPAFDSYLARVFDEFGLIISGWSAEWDTALINAIIRCPNHRFATYWTDRGRRKPQAQDLIKHRRAELTKVIDADSFFQELEEKVTSLEEINQNHPLDAKVAVQTLKRYLAEDKHKIRLHDFVLDEVEQVYQKMLSNDFSLNRNFTNSEFIQRVKKYEVIVEKIINIIIYGCYWGEEKHDYLWVKSLARVVNIPETFNQTYDRRWKSLSFYPALMILYVSGIAAIASDNYILLKDILTQVKIKKFDKEKPVLLSLYTWEVMNKENAQMLLDRERRYTPLSDYLFDILRNLFRNLIPNDDQYQYYFDSFEYLFSLIHADIDLKFGGNGSTPMGRFRWLTRTPQCIISQIDLEIEQYKDDWLPLKSGLFDGQIDRFLQLRKSCIEQIRELRW